MFFHMSPIRQILY